MMSLVLLALAAPAAPNTAAIDRSRAAFVTCLKQASSDAKPGEVTADTFAAFVKARCAEQQKALADAMVAFDMRNGASRRSAADGADLAIEDYVETAKNVYLARTAN